ncbi:hypothetical protein Cgig2_008119 [Carnegiea gigantea]|uniref:Piezo non-specific cation channel R-Ras-binding domain-containing protein n=1 Tax=Carnegiea gigantea TaxID=171969 RepID=A0A9Q1L235_9CARY|nr:hypothetical protein Cgig2_008119 [Carnegiea gigantea]
MSLFLKTYVQSYAAGLIVDDPRTLLSYFLVFMFACFKFRADRSPSLSGAFTYYQMISQRKNIFVWKDLSFETKSIWTIFDYLRLYCYCHLLDLVLTLILVTGTLEYDVLHLGYLCFALFFFRMRLEILRKRNKVFKFLRMYNFVIIVLSLAYQSPFIGVFNEGKCGTVGYIYEVIGFYKYDYGFRITSRSALVEIIIFMLVSLQSYMFSSPDFEHVSRYLEAEQVGAIVREKEKRAAWKTAQLQHIRESEEKKRQRNMQVEKMKSEMLDLQSQLQSMNPPGNASQVSPVREGLRKRVSPSLNFDQDGRASDKEDLVSPSSNLARNVRTAAREQTMWGEEHRTTSDVISQLHGSPVSKRSESPTAEENTRQDSQQFSFGEITEIEEDTTHQSIKGNKETSTAKSKEHPLKSAVQMIGDGVSQVQSLGNRAVSNLANFLNVAHEDGDSRGSSSEDDGRFDQMESQNAEYTQISRTASTQSDESRTMSQSIKCQLVRIFRYVWSQMRSNNDIVCYCCFILVFLWNFSLLSMVYLAALFLYALCANTGPGYKFWVIMLIYAEVYILVEYLYQIIIQHCGLRIDSPFLQELGFPYHKIKSSFVISSLPLFLVYLFTLLQSSITAQDGDWTAFTELDFFKRKMRDQKYVIQCSSWREKLKSFFQPLEEVGKMIIRSCVRYWKSLTQGAESPPYLVQLSMDVGSWPEDGVQPEKIESGVNQLLKIVHGEHCKGKIPNDCLSASRVNIQSIERSQENPNVALVVFEVVYASTLSECTPEECSKSLTPAADVAKEINIAKNSGFVDEVGFPYPILSVIGGGKRDVDLYAYIFGADLAVFFLVAIFYQSVIKNKSEFLDVYQLEDQFPKEFVFILMISELASVLFRRHISPDLIYTISGNAASRQLTRILALSCYLSDESLSPYSFRLYNSLWDDPKSTTVSAMYSSGNPTNIANPIKDASVQVDIQSTGGRMTLYQTTLCEKLKWDEVKSNVDLDPKGFLTTYDKNDIQLICCQADASTLWLVPEVVQMRFTKSLEVDTEMRIIFSWVLTRDRPKGKEVVRYERIVEDPSDLPINSDIQAVLNGTMNSFRVYNIYARYFRVTGSGDVRPFEPEVAVGADLVINHQNPEWWSFFDINPLNVTHCEGLVGPMAIVVSEETPLGRFIRLQCSDLRMRIPYENLPSCDSPDNVAIPSQSANLYSRSLEQMNRAARIASALESFWGYKNLHNKP